MVVVGVNGSPTRLRRQCHNPSDPPEHVRLRGCTIRHLGNIIEAILSRQDLNGSPARTGRGWFPQFERASWECRIFATKRPSGSSDLISASRPSARLYYAAPRFASHQ